jgi:phage gp16-like protein
MARPFSALASRHLKTSTGKSDTRRKLMMAVRAACRRLGLEDDDRKAIQLEVTGKESMADMSLSELGQTLDRLNRDQSGGFSNRSHFANRPHIGKIRALWWTLYWLNEVAEPNDAALDAFVLRQTGLQSIRFLDHSRAPSVIEALKSMAERAGVRWPTAAGMKIMFARDPASKMTLQRLERHAVLQAIWDKLLDAKLVLMTNYVQYCQRALPLSPNHWVWSERELDELIRALGKKLRRELARRAANEE